MEGQGVSCEEDMGGSLILLYTLTLIYSLCVAGYSFFQIETFSRVHYLMVRSDRQLQEWVRAFECLDSSNAQVRQGRGGEGQNDSN